MGLYYWLKISGYRLRAISALYQEKRLLFI